MGVGNASFCLLHSYQYLSIVCRPWSETLSSTCYIIFHESSIPFYSTSYGYTYNRQKEAFSPTEIESIFSAWCILSYFMGSQTLPSTCYILSPNLVYPFTLRVTDILITGRRKRGILITGRRKPRYNKRVVSEILAFIRTDGQTDMARSTVGSETLPSACYIYFRTLWGRKRFLLPVTYFPFTLRVTGIIRMSSTSTEISAFIRTDGVARSTRLVILIKNQYTLRSRKLYLLPVTYFPIVSLVWEKKVGSPVAKNSLELDHRQQDLKLSHHWYLGLKSPSAKNISSARWEEYTMKLF